MMITNTIVLLAARLVLAVESGGLQNPPDGDGGRAVGPYQMWPCAVREANRIVGRELWTTGDRRNPQLSRAMCLVTLQHHYNRGVTNVVDLACRWRNPYSVCPEWHVKKIRREHHEQEEGE